MPPENKGDLAPLTYAIAGAPSGTHNKVGDLLLRSAPASKDQSLKSKDRSHLNTTRPVQNSFSFYYWNWCEQNVREIWTLKLVLRLHRLDLRTGVWDATTPSNSRAMNQKEPYEPCCVEMVPACRIRCITKQKWTQVLVHTLPLTYIEHRKICNCGANVNRVV